MADFNVRGPGCDNRGKRGHRGPRGLPGSSTLGGPTEGPGALNADEDIPPGSVIAAGGSARRALAEGGSRAHAIGIATAFAARGSVVKYVLAGIAELSPSTWDAVTGESGGLVEGEVYYLSQTIPGHLTREPPAPEGPRVGIGIALSASVMDVQIGAVSAATITETGASPIAVARVDNQGVFDYQYGFSGIQFFPETDQDGHPTGSGDIGLWVANIAPDVPIIPQVTLIHINTSRDVSIEVQAGVAPPGFPPNFIRVSVRDLSDFGRPINADFYIAVFQVVTKTLPLGPAGPRGPTGAASTIAGPTGPTGPAGSTTVERLSTPGAAAPNIDWSIVDSPTQPTDITLANGSTDGQEKTISFVLEGRDYSVTPANGTVVNFSGVIGTVCYRWDANGIFWRVISYYTPAVG